MPNAFPGPRTVRAARALNRASRTAVPVLAVAMVVFFLVGGYDGALPVLPWAVPASPRLAARDFVPLLWLTAALQSAATGVTRLHHARPHTVARLRGWRSLSYALVSFPLLALLWAPHAWLARADAAAGPRPGLRFALVLPFYVPAVVVTVAVWYRGRRERRARLTTA